MVCLLTDSVEFNDNDNFDKEIESLKKEKIIALLGNDLQQAQVIDLRIGMLELLRERLWYKHFREITIDE